MAGDLRAGRHGGAVLDGVVLAAFVNESQMESSFGQADMRTQYRHPDQQHYCRAGVGVRL